jgi:diguanylate cyclase (GGDEF)-like protein
MAKPWRPFGTERRASPPRAAPARNRDADEQDDRLTGARGRESILEELRNACTSAAVEGENIAIAYVDVDHFETITDAYGALVGDQCLREIVRRLGECVREGDVVGRFAGDEFLVVFRSLAARIQSYALVTRMRTRLAEPIKTGNLEVVLSVFCGVANYPMDGRDTTLLITAAAAEMQRTKEATHAAAALAGDIAEP